MLRNISFAFLCVLLVACGQHSANDTKSGSAATAAKQDSSGAWQPVDTPDNGGYRKKVIEVSSFEELYKNIGPNRTLKLKAGKEFIIPAKLPAGDPNMYVTMDIGLSIKGIDNMKIIGEGKEPVKVTQPNASYRVFALSKCTNIIFENINAGHLTKQAGCSASVISADNCEDIYVNNSILYGCGFEGITASRVNRLNCNNVVIKECSSQILSLVDCRNTKFYNCRFTDNAKEGGSGKLYIGNNEAIYFTSCAFTNNAAYVDKPNDQYLFNTDKAKTIILKDCTITGNKAKNLVTNPAVLKMTNTKVENNSWQKPV